MATRCNIKIVDEAKETHWLYRHWDGYPAETGKNLQQTLRDIGPDGDSKRFIEALLAQRYDLEKWDKEARPVYERTDGLHGDIEWLYTIRFAGTDTTVETSSVR